MKTKILFFIPTLMNGGAERVLVNLVNNMDFDNFDISVKAVLNTGRYIESLDKRIHYSYIFSGYRRGTSWLMKLLTPKQAYNLFIGNQYDIVVSYLEGYTSRILAGCPYPNVKKVSWIHIEMLNRESLTANFRSYTEAINCYRSFDKIICVSEIVKQRFEEATGLCHNTMVLYNTNDTVDIMKRKDEPNNDIYFSHDCINIVSVAKLSPTKGFDRLAHIHKRLLEEGIKNHVYIFGTGSAQYDIEPYLRQEKLEDTFTFVGYRENPYKYVAQSDLYVCSSRREGFSTAVTEALIIGVPVVSTRCSGAEELLGSNNEYGIVTDNDEEALYQGVKMMCVNQELRSYYKVQAKKRGTYFSTEKTVQAVEKMLQSL